MSHEDENVFEIMARLDNRREFLLRQKIREIDFRKQDYERVYHIQFDEYRLHNSRFRHKPAKAIEPEDYSRILDAELLATARELEREQIEQQQEQQEKQEQNINMFPDGQKDEEQQLGEEQELQEERDIDQRRLAFRQRMKELEKDRERWQQLQQNNDGRTVEASNDNAEQKAEEQAEDQDIDPRILAFRQRMKEMEEERERYRGKDIERD